MLGKDIRRPARPFGLPEGCGQPWPKRNGGAPVTASPELGYRAGRTLELADSRGYSLTLQNLSRLLLGGPVEPEALREAVREHGGLEFDGAFVGLRGNHRSEKCARRLEANGRWLPLALDIARHFAREYSRICPY